MNLAQNLVFNRCFCCNKNFNVACLIELHSNSVVIGEESLFLSSLVLDVCLVVVSSWKRFADGNRF